SAKMPTGTVSGLTSERGAILRTILPEQVASWPPESRLVMEMPLAAPSMMVLAMTEPEKANSEKIATLPERMHILPLTWQLWVELSRTAVKAQSAIRLSATMTSSARKILMPLPFCPLPPPRHSILAMVLPDTMEPSGPLASRQMRMPALPQPSTRLPAITSPRLFMAWMAASAMRSKRQSRIVAPASVIARPTLLSMKWQRSMAMSLAPARVSGAREDEPK